MLNKTLTAAAVAAALLSAGTASAAPLPISLTNLDGTFSPWQGIDWASQGTVVIDGFVPVAGDIFTLEYFGRATTLQYENGNDLVLPGLNTTYEYTVRAVLTEMAAAGCSAAACSFITLGGSFSVYYDTLTGSGAGIAGNYRTGAGITDGTLLLAGTVPAQLGGAFFATSATSGSGFAPTDSNIFYTDPAFITPDLAGANSLTTLAIGGLNGASPNTSGWRRVDITGRPGALPGTSVALTGAELVLQGDSSSSVTSVPEPASLALFGIALAGFGAARRRKLAV